MIRNILIGSLVLWLSACGDSNQVDVIQRAVQIESADECHLCGMLIERFPGPKGQLFQRNDSHSQKFCSTRDLFAYLLQPEVRHRVTQVYVHDMAIASWESPDDSAFIDARQAYYVIGHNQQGAMGPTLASFKHQGDAEQFSQRFGGHLIRFEDITLTMLGELSMTSH